jgi:TRAP-type mannitol/chloroaromatic compound transport system substrate-binding protein
MDRRAFLITSGGAAVAAASSTSTASRAKAADLPTPGLRADATVLRLSMAWPDIPQGPADSVGRLARRIQTMTEGRFGIEIVPASGQDADLVHGSAHDFAARHPAFAYFAGLPGAAGLSAHDFAHWLAVGGGQMLWDDLAAEHGWVPLLAGHSGEAPPLWSKTPIGTPGDLAGRRVAVPGLGADVMRALGAEPSAAAPGEIVAALDEAHVHAVESGGLLQSLAAGVARVACHATGDGVNRHGTAYALNIGLAVWERLSTADRAIFAAAAAEEFQLSVAEARAHERLSRDVLARSFGVQFAPWPVEIAEAIDRLAEATVAHVAAHDVTAARIDHSYMAFRGALSGTSAPRRPGPVA